MISLAKLQRAQRVELSEMEHNGVTGKTMDDAMSPGCNLDLGRTRVLTEGRSSPMRLSLPPPTNGA